MEQMRWINRELPTNPDIETLAKHLSAKTPFPLSLANILVQRGYDTLDKVKALFRPSQDDLHDPWLMKDMDLATVRIIEAVTQQEKIMLFGDYDVDGTTSVALLKLFFQDWEVEVDYYIPDRYKEGYGLSEAGINHAKETGVSLVIAQDCGTKAVALVDMAREMGIDFIIVDHHRPGNKLPPAVAMLNPLQDGCPYPCKVLSACGLTLKLIQALDEEFRTVIPESLPGSAYDPFRRYCDLVTLSIASDIVPIVDENRTIAAHGLAKLRTAPLPGIAALMALSPNPRPWYIADLVFFIGPRINSAGRLRSGRAAVRLLLGDPEEREDFANALQAYNTERQELDREMTEEALEMIRQDPAGPSKASTVLHQKHWHKGVVGIVASRVIEHYHRPTILLTQSDDRWVGSARSVPGFDVYQALLACEEHIFQFGGHKYAAGLTVLDAEMESFKAAFESEVKTRITAEQKMPELEIAYEVSFRDINAKFLRLLRNLAPFGPENPEPIFLAREVEVTDARILKEKHVRFLLRQDGLVMEAIAFNLGPRWMETDGTLLHVAFQADFKTWKGVTSIQLQVKDFKTA